MDDQKKKAIQKITDAMRQICAESGGAPIVTAAVQGSICIMIEDKELWLSIDQMEELIEQLSETLLDASAQLVNDFYAESETVRYAKDQEDAKKLN